METRFLHASTVIESLRDNGYNNTAYALAELIDNSIQANASRVELGFIEEKVGGANKNSFNVTEITIWDNGKGMSPAELLLAMQFGGSLHKLDPHGMGKFGMGLPNSSISQCRRVDVWSWVDGSEPHHTYLDIDEMKDGSLEIIPRAKPKEIPAKYKATFFEQAPKSGTLVKWSKLDRLNWKTGKSNFKHCEYLVGRMYREYLANERVKIDATTYRPITSDTLSVYERHPFKANDPMYLMKNSSLPELPGKYKREAFFELADEETIPVAYTDSKGNNVQGDVIIRTSIAKNNIARYILETQDSNISLGATKWGKHCARNIGVSVMRAGRELVLRDTFLSSEIRRNKARFLGVEITFPPSLDELFGVTNNKQDAVKLHPHDIEELREQAGFDSEQEYLDDLHDNNDPYVHTLNVISRLKIQVRAAEKRLENLTVSLHHTKSDKPSELQASAIATMGAKKRDEQGYQARDSSQVNQSELEKLLIDAAVASEFDAPKKAEDILNSGVSFLIETAPKDSHAFFDVSTQKGMTLVIFNSNHVFYKQLVSKLPQEQLRVMELAIAGFARVMNETTSDARANYLNTVRRDWGKVITDFLDDGSDDEFI